MKGTTMFMAIINSYNRYIGIPFERAEEKLFSVLEKWDRPFVEKRRPRHRA